MHLSKENKKKIIFMIREGVSIKEISDRFNVPIPLIYNFLKMTMANDKSIEFDKLRVSVQINLLMIEENYDAALEICNRKENLNNMNIQEQQVRILLKMFQQTQNNIYLERALVVCDNNPEMNNCKKYKNRINKYMGNLDRNCQVTNLLSNICYGSTSVEEISSSDIDSFEKAILIISYYEKYNKQKGLDYIKELKKEYADKKELKILNLLYERLNSKKLKIFDVSIYTNYLNCTVDISMAKIQTIPEVEEIKIESKPKIVEKIPVVRKKTVYKPQQVNEVKNSRYNRYNNPNSHNDSKVVNNMGIIIENRKIKDVFPREVLVIGTYIYVEMNSIDNQRRAIEAWDNFECLIEKSCDDTNAMDRMISIIEKFRLAGLLNSNIVVEENKFSKKKTK